MTLLPLPPAPWRAIVAPPPQEGPKALLRRQHPPPPPPLPRRQPLPLPCQPQALSSHCPPCRRRGRARTLMSPFRRSGFQEEKLLPSFNVTPFPKRQSCSLDGGVKATCGCHRHSALSGQEELVHTKLKKLLVQDIFFYSDDSFTFPLFKISGAFPCLLNC